MRLKKTFLILFFIYWAVAFFVLLPNKSLSKKSFFGILFPPVYSMFAPPVDQELDCQYLFYSKGKLVKQISSSEFYRSKFENEYYTSDFLKYKREYLVAFLKFKDLKKAFEWYAYKKEMNEIAPDLSFLAYVDSLPNRQTIYNQIKITEITPESIVDEYPYLRESDSVVYHLIYKPLKLPSSYNKQNKFTAWLGEQNIYTGCIIY